MKGRSGLIFSVHIFERLEQWLSDKDRRLYAAEERERERAKGPILD